MIICPKCGKENQDHYKFCLGCGNELPRDGGAKAPFRPTPPAVVSGNRPGGVSAPGPFVPPTAGSPAPVGVVPAPGPFAPHGPPAPMAPPAPASAPAPMAPPAPMGVPVSIASPVPSGFPATCPQCASPNPRANRFCITCGFDMTTAVSAPASAAAQPPAPAPAPVAQPPQPAPIMQPSPYVPPAAPQSPFAGPATPQAGAPVGVLPPPGPAPFSAPVSNGASQSAGVERARLVLIRPDGSEGPTHTLHEGENPIGRETAALFASDTYLSPKHATFTIQGPAVTVRDEGALNGVYVRIERQTPVELRDNDIFRIGQEILRFEALGPIATQPDGTERIGAEVEGLVGKVSLVTGRDTVGNAFPVPVMGIYLGRERGDILFPDDGYVSGLHCQLIVNSNRVSLLDVGSSNGTYVRLRAPRSLRNGDFLLLGQQLFRLQMLG